MHRFTFLSIFLSFGAFAASMTADLPEVVSNRTTSDQQEIDWEDYTTMGALRKHFVRTDGMEVEPRDVICGMYSRLGNIDDSFRSNPLSLETLLLDEDIFESFKRKLHDLSDKCEQDFPTYEADCISAMEALLFIDVTVYASEIFYMQQLCETEETVGEVLTKTDMCGEGWKYGQKYLKMRNRWVPDEKGSPEIRIPV